MKFISTLIIIISFVIPLSSNAATKKSNGKHPKKICFTVKKKCCIANEAKKCCDKVLIEPWPHPGFHLTNGNIDLLISGQLNQDMIYIYDGARSRIFYGDNDVSASTLRFTTTAKVPGWFDIFSIIEFGIKDQSSRDVSQLNPTPGNSFNLRIGEVGIDSKCFGRFSLGQGYTATDYTAEVDLSGVDAVLTSAIQKMGGGVIFSSAVDGSLIGNPAIQNVFDNLDGLNRRTRLRYDTPEWEGFKLSASIIERSDMDAALRYHKEVILFKFAAAIGYASSSLILEQNHLPGRNLDGSASILFCNGWNATFASGSVFAREHDRENPVYQYGKLGYQIDYFCIGKTNLGIDTSLFRNFNRNGDKGREYGAVIDQNFTAWNADIYIAARHFTLNHSNKRYNPINLAVIGMRVKF